jgi:hypothetical protein
MLVRAALYSPPLFPNAFIEHGAIMAAMVLNSPSAVAMSVQVVRAFVRLREMLGTHKDLARKLEEIEKKYDAQFKTVFDAIRQLMAPPAPRPKRIGFRVEEARPTYQRRRLRSAPSR